MFAKMRSHPSLGTRLKEKISSKGTFTFIPRAWLPRILVLWIIIVALVSRAIYNTVDAEYKERRREALESMCDQRARILEDQFNVTINHVYSLALLISIFHYSQSVSTIDQV